MRKKCIEKEIAINDGKLFYFTGKPCKRGHISERRVNNGDCVKCGNIRSTEQWKRIKVDPVKYEAEKKRLREYYDQFLRGP